MSELPQPPDAVPVPVVIAPEQPPVPVVVTAAQPAPATVTKGEGTTLAPTTTEQEDKVTQGQRLINVLWEVTQSVIAIMVVGSTMVKAFILLQGQEIPTIMAVAFGTVVGFYFSRVNHQAIGGVGKKPDPQPYQGR